MITKRQKQILDFIEKYDQRHGFAPSLKEIKNHFKLSSESTVHQHVEALIEKGFLQKHKNLARGIELIKDEVIIPKKRSKSPSKRNLKLNTIHLIDAIEGLKSLSDEIADVIVVDPPYNIGKDFGNNLDKRELNDYINWCISWMDECVRILKPSGTLFIYGFSEILAHLSVNLKLNKRWLIWHYTNKNVASLNFWQRSHESIICAWKDKPFFNRDLVREPYTEGFLSGAAGKVRKGTHGRFSSGNKETTYNAHKDGALPRDVIKVAALAGGAGMIERWFLCKTCNDVFEPTALKNHRDHNTVKHPTQKPLELTQKLIKSSAPANKAFIVVPFVGSGSECIVAKRLDHDFIGFEINPEYVKLSTEWLNRT